MPVSINPADLSTIRSYEDYSDNVIEDIITASNNAFLKWQMLDIRERVKPVLKFAELLDNNAEIYRKTITEEMGKVFAESVSEIKKCAASSTFFAENAENFLKNTSISSEFQKSYISFKSLGVILAVMPWNFPFWQVIRAAIPIILAGNCVILKHASNVSGCALLIENIFKDAGFPDGVFKTIITPGSNVHKLIEHKFVKGVTFTGSTDVGRKIASVAGQNIKKSVLELGGSDPYIILEDADIELSTEKCATSRLINAGQSCISAKRFIVSAKIYDKFLENFTTKMKNVRFGDPYDKTNKIGPIVSIAARDELHKIVEKFNASGVTRTICGGKIPDMKGAYYPPTILEVLDNNRLEDIEIFGPIALVLKAKDDNEAIKLANNSKFGLGAAIFTQDKEKAEMLAENCIQAGCVFINDFVKSDARFPFGGIKESGYGRELSEHGMKEFTNIKTIIMP